MAFLEKQQSILSRFYQDWKNHRSADFAQQLRVGQTGCRYLLCQFQSPIPRQAAAKIRNHNLRIFSKAFEDVLLKPGQILSFYRLLRNRPEPPKEKMGAKPNPETIVKVGPHFDVDEVEMSEEAGLGQIASSLYYLALLADFEILEHHPAQVQPKFFGLDYVPLGFEACVLWPYRDLRFRNTLPFDTAIQVQTASDYVIATLYGKVRHEMSNALTSEVLSSGPQPGAARVRISRRNLKNNQIVDTQTIAEREYDPPEGIE